MSASAAPIFSDRVYQCFLPTPKTPSAEWIPANVRAPNGDPFNYYDFPYAQGVLEAFDDPIVRRITLQWATRLGKTTIGHAYSLYVAAVIPAPMLFAQANEGQTLEAMRDGLIPMFEKCPATKHQLPPPYRRGVHRIPLLACRLRVGWSGSPASLGGFSAWFVHRSEAAKWSVAKSSEGDSLALSAERAKEFIDYKILTEGSPTIQGECPIEAEGANAPEQRFYVPCPACGTDQTLKIRSGEPGDVGLVWEGLTPDEAKRSARYVCEKCGHEIDDAARGGMIRGGVWLAKGQVRGDAPLATESRTFQLSSLYSLRTTWGEVASARVRCGRNPRLIQNFVNSWEGETYSLFVKRRGIEEIKATLVVPSWRRGKVPPGAMLVTMGVDVQADHQVYVACAWFEEERGCLFDWGYCDSWKEVADTLATRWDTAEGLRYGVALALVDSGYDTKVVYQFCADHSGPALGVLPSKGANTDLGGKPFKQTVLDEEGKTKGKRKRRVAFGKTLILVNTLYWQRAVQNWLDLLTPDAHGGLGLVAEAADDDDLLSQLINEAYDPEKKVFDLVDGTIPNDFRDALRYARVAAEVKTRGKWRAMRRLAMVLPAPGKQITAAPAPAPETKRHGFVREMPRRGRIDPR